MSVTPAERDMIEARKVEVAEEARVKYDESQELARRAWVEYYLATGKAETPSAEVASE